MERDTRKFVCITTRKHHTFMNKSETKSLDMVHKIHIGLNNKGNTGLMRCCKSNDKNPETGHLYEGASTSMYRPITKAVHNINGNILKDETLH
jgi:hypothetical protein